MSHYATFRPGSMDDEANQDDRRTLVLPVARGPLRVRVTILDMLDAHGPMTANRLRDALNLKAAAVHEALAVLEGTGEVARTETPRRGPSGKASTIVEFRTV